MIISPNMKKTYPTLSTWINDNLPKVRKKVKVFTAFIKYSEQSKLKSNEALTKGNQPTIDFRVMPDANGEFEGGKFPNTVFLAKQICEKFEKNAADQKNAKMHILLESTLLHEMVHWGDWKDGVDQAGEEGKAFEIAAYGKDIDRYW